MRKNYRSKPFKGGIRIGKYSGLRKLMRAARRNKIPDERLVIIQMAERKSQRVRREISPFGD